MGNYAIETQDIKRQLFSGYIKRYKDGRLFDVDSYIPLSVIWFYLESDLHSGYERDIYNRFKEKYILSENRLEGIKVTKKEVKELVENSNMHTKEEVLGLADVYDYIANYSFDKLNNLNIYQLLRIHNILYSHTPFPEFSGQYRTSSARIAGSKIELCDASIIPIKMYELYKEVERILTIRNIEEYINSIVDLHCELIHIHPFRDGNGRSTRAFMNLLLRYIGLPPIYVKLEEKEKYCTAIENYILDNEKSHIRKFFMFKIANAIIENDDEFYKQAIKIL